MKPGSLCCALLSLVLSSSSHAGDAQWRGKNRDGHYPGTELLEQWPDEGPELLWSTEELYPGYGAPSVTADAVYVTGTKDQVEYLFALDMSGKVRWKTEMGASFEGDFALARCTPTVRDGQIYVLSSAGRISRIDAATGKTEWSVDARTRFAGSPGTWGTAENLLVVDSMVIYTPGGNRTTMVALDAETGETVWQTRSLKDHAAYASPIVFTHAGRKVVANVTANYIFGVDAASGELLWQYSYGTLEAPPIEWGAPYVNTITPIYHDGQIYTTSGYDHVGALFTLADDGHGVSVAWTDKTMDTHHGGVVLVDGYLYGANWINNRTGNWCSIDWKTGRPGYETRWHTKGSIIYADGMLYCYEEGRGNLALVKASPESFDVVSSFQITQGEGPHWTHPVISEGVLYVRHGKALMAYVIRADPAVTHAPAPPG